MEILGADLDADVELRVCDDGAGMTAEAASAALAGRGRRHRARATSTRRLQSTFGAEYGLEMRVEPGDGTIVTMLVPKFRAGVRAA